MSTARKFQRNRKHANSRFKNARKLQADFKKSLLGKKTKEKQNPVISRLKTNYNIDDSSTILD